MYEVITEPSLLYGCEVWKLKVHGRKRVEAVEMIWLRNIFAILEELIGFRTWKLGDMVEKM